MKITKKQLKLIIESYLLTEDLADNVSRQTGLTDQEKIEMIRVASNKPHRLQKYELLWLAKYFLSPEGIKSIEPIEDIVSKIKDFKHAVRAGRIASLGKSTDIKNYNSPGDLTRVATRSAGSLDISEIAKESQLLYDGPDWAVYMPFTREASCTLGSGTSWCTAIRLKGNNLFYNYVLKQGVILYYVIYKGQKPLDEMYKKMALGFIHNQIKWTGKQSGGITVNAYNNGIAREEFINVIDSVSPDNVGEKIINILTNHGKSLKGTHPARSKILEIIDNPILLKRELNKKSNNAIIDFVKSVVEYATSKKIKIKQEVVDVMNEKCHITIKDLKKALLTPHVQGETITPATEDNYNEVAMFDLYSQAKMLIKDYGIGTIDEEATVFVKQHVNTGVRKEIVKAVKNFTIDQQRWSSFDKGSGGQQYGTLEEFLSEYFDIEYYIDEGSALFDFVNDQLVAMGNNSKQAIEYLYGHMYEEFFKNGWWFHDDSHARPTDTTFINLHDNPEYFYIVRCKTCIEDAESGYTAKDLFHNY